MPPPHLLSSPQSRRGRLSWAPQASRILLSLSAIVLSCSGERRRGEGEARPQTVFLTEFGTIHPLPRLMVGPGVGLDSSPPGPQRQTDVRSRQARICRSMSRLFRNPRARGFWPPPDLPQHRPQGKTGVVHIRLRINTTADTFREKNAGKRAHLP